MNHRTLLLDEPDQALEPEAPALARQIAGAPAFALGPVRRSPDAQGLRIALRAHFDTHQLSHRRDEHAAARARRPDSTPRARASARTEPAG